ncbi:hypothetical protein KR51_00032050 [Rubidibacter lacunae KORDI 51-2]|uniref:GlsB/YeaQ/YmgE family stress response membrane protein n=1 Tax=Rubidibacter lacunae KORDI 51-2 TaxID=582515 RepID=U5D6I2_9CHRO|nr:hypothetical protein [Rubidibacter lacunae]ERN40263.1 hypothetical protein KR51_00032050 [Rubidibacter lacunae KORDI 51-2]
MTFIELLALLAIAMVCGSLGQQLVGYSAGGCLISLVVGAFGAYLGLWMANHFGLPVLLPINFGGREFPVLWSILGSALFSIALGLVNAAIRPRRRR